LSNNFRVVHFTDIHLSQIRDVRFSRLFSKRFLGYLNLRFKRLKEHSNKVAMKAAKSAAALNPDHVLITGDLANLAFDSEYREVLRWLNNLGMSSDAISIIPGNHDAYIKSVWPDGPFKKHLGRFCLSDDAEAQRTTSFNGFPFVRDRGAIRIIGCSTAVPAPPFIAWGRLGNQQLALIQNAVKEGVRANKFCLIGIHHPPQEDVTRWDNGLIDAKNLRRGLRKFDGTECMVLHGHMHKAMKGSIQNECTKNISVWGTGSASLISSAQFRVLDFVEGRPSGNQLYCLSSERDEFIPVSRDLSGG